VFRGARITSVDGDTVRVKLADGRFETVRLIGIDTPETKKPDVPVECGGPDATDAM
jgi:micrococcal nuclease